MKIKVRLVTTVAYERKSGYTNEDWLQKLELKVSGTTGNVNVKCGNMQPIDNRDTKPLLKSPMPFDDRLTGPIVHAAAPPAKTATQYHLTLSMARSFCLTTRAKLGCTRTDKYQAQYFRYTSLSGVRLDIDSRYAEIILDSNIREVNARIMSGSMTMKDADNLVLNNSYGSVYASNIGHAEVELYNGWFHAKDIPTLEIDSKVSTVELGVLGKVKIYSNDDQYEIEEAGVIDGEKNYGSIRVITLRNSLDLTGVNADIKVHNIEPGVSVVKIDGQYADLRLPVDNLKDYTVNFEGRGSNLYTPFERLHATDSSFNVKVGTGKKNSFQLKCSNCTVDMK